jgi:hypothetical protein
MLQPCEKDSHQGQCSFVVDPSDHFRFVCLKCGFDRSLKKKDEPKKKKSNLDQILFIVAVIAAFVVLIYVAQLEDNKAQSGKSNIPQPAQKR